MWPVIPQDYSRCVPHILRLGLPIEPTRHVLGRRCAPIFATVWAVEHVDSDKELERTLAQQVILKYYSDSELEVDDLKIATVVAEEYLSGKEDATDSSYVEESAYLENELEHPDNRTILDILEEGEE